MHKTIGKLDQILRPRGSSRCNILILLHIAVTSNIEFNLGTVRRGLCDESVDGDKACLISRYCRRSA